MRVIDAKNVEELLKSLAIVPNVIIEKWLNEHTVKAIPVEFIEEQIAKTTDISNRDELDVLYAGNLGYLLKLWEKENENRDTESIK